jgi:hypothetical protein
MYGAAEVAAHRPQFAAEGPVLTVPLTGSGLVRDLLAALTRSRHRELFRRSEDPATAMMTAATRIMSPRKDDHHMLQAETAGGHTAGTGQSAPPGEIPGGSWPVLRPEGRFGCGSAGEPRRTAGWRLRGARAFVYANGKAERPVQAWMVSRPSFELLQTPVADPGAAGGAGMPRILLLAGRGQIQLPGPGTLTMAGSCQIPDPPGGRVCHHAALSLPADGQRHPRVVSVACAGVPRPAGPSRGPGGNVLSGTDGTAEPVGLRRPARGLSCCR